MAKQQKTSTRECKVEALQLVKSSDCIPLSHRSALSCMSNRGEHFPMLALHQSGSRSKMSSSSTREPILIHASSLVRWTAWLMPVCDLSYNFSWQETEHSQASKVGRTVIFIRMRNGICQKMMPLLRRPGGILLLFSD